MFNFRVFKEEHQRGFTLLLAALIASIVLSLGASIFVIAQKQISLSSAGRNSQFAFYAADTAAECALFWDERSDIHPNTFATSSADTGHASSVLCDGQTASLTVTASDSNSATTVFSYMASAGSGSSGYCANVSVIKSYNPLSQAYSSVVHADGFSTLVSAAASCSPGSPAGIPTVVQNDPDALERSVELRY